MKISIITACYNSEKTIKRTIESVLNQDYTNLEYIVIDGCSKDGTLDVINQYREKIDILISETDKGIYDAINKGILLSTGDVIGILNSDDVFYDNYIISSIALKFIDNANLDSIIGDIVFLNSKNKIHRYYTSSNWTPKKFSWGIMPPHPSFYCKKNIFLKFGLYRLDFVIAADYELLIRFLLINKIIYEYIPKIIVKMSLGGLSTKNILSNIKINKEVLRACRINNVSTNILKLYSKYFFKVKELL